MNMKNDKNFVLNKIDWIRWAIYLITLIFLTYLFFICFIAKPNQIVFGNVFIKTSRIDFGGFGSLLSGIFSPLAFLWLILNFRQQDKNLRIAEEQFSILLEDKQAKNQLLKPIFKFTNFETCIEDEIVDSTSRSLILMKLLCESDKKLKNCYLIVEDPTSPLKPYNKFSSNMHNKKRIRSFSENTPQPIVFCVDLKKLDNKKFPQWDISLLFINTQGYTQKLTYPLTLHLERDENGKIIEHSFHIMDWDNFI